MASNPPFQMEDQTDEDFFDKLVEDDDDNIVPTVFKSTEANDETDAAAIAFSNLTVGDDFGSMSDNYDEKEKVTDPVDAISAPAPAPEPVPAPAPAGAQAGDDGNDSLGFETSVIDSKNDGEEWAGQPEAVGFDLNSSENIGSMNSGVKEVGWNSFYADSKENGVHGFGSYSDFFNDFGENPTGDFPGKVDEITATTSVLDQNSVSSHGQYHDGGGQVYGAYNADNGNEQDLNSIQYWESMYPGWKYDANTGQWYQVDGGYEGNFQGTFEGSGVDGSGQAGVSFLQHTTAVGTTTTVENGSPESLANWNQVSQVNNGYPEHMVFDPQYPGWYYDTIALEWRSLESYNASVQPMIQDSDQQNQNGFASTVAQSQSNSYNVYGEYGQGDSYASQGLGSPGGHGNLGDSFGNYNIPGLNMWQPGTAVKTEAVSSFAGNQQPETSFGSNMPVNNLASDFNSHNSLQEVQSLNSSNQVHTDANGVIALRGFVPSEKFNQQYNQTNIKQNEQMHFSNDFYGGQNSVNVSQQPLHSNQQFAYASNTGRSSAGCPPHALVTFGFGGKIIVMKDGSPMQNSSFGAQDSVGASISVLNLLEVVNGSPNLSGAAVPACDYFRSLCQQSFPGPLVGNVSSKELNKWIDERIANCESLDMDYRKCEALKLLLSVLKISYQHYGKLRSPFGSDTLLKETDTPESAVAKLFASAKSKDTPYDTLSNCLQQLPPEGLIQATAIEVQKLLISGRKQEALQRAQEGQLWGPALVLASQLGNQFYIDTVKQMALHQLVAGSPLRTLCLLIAGQPAEVFSSGTGVDSLDMSQQHTQMGTNYMLRDWEENLAVITANRTKDDELVIIHLGDCLWKERSEITAAHICYLVAEANFESYSDSARMCLIGADHWKFPRTYASAEAIQRTELYEYSKVLGNSQFILLPFQPYKLLYAYMLAEVGKVSDSLKYCQAVLKSLKTGRAPEVETWKQLVLSLDERLRIHQQGGYAANLAPARIVNKLLNFFDSTAHRVVGGLPPPAPSTSHRNSHGNDQFHQQTGPRVSASQSTTVMSSLMSSSSMEPISDWAGRGADGKMTVHNRSVSEPDFGRTPRQVDSSKEAEASTTQKASGSAGSSRFAFGFGSHLLQKTVGLVLRPRSDKQAKLGKENKFYYDEKLKRWVEEGVEPPAEEAALPPPPTTITAFQNGMFDNNSTSNSEGSLSSGSPEFRNPAPAPIENASGVPPIPTTSNQFSARGRMGVRARYVDTFNRGAGGQANLFQSPPIPPVKPAVAANAKFFVPAPAPSNEQMMEAIAENAQEENATNNNPTTSNANEFYQSPPQLSPVTMQRPPSMDNLADKGATKNVNGFPPHSRRTASWSGGSFGNTFAPSPNKSETGPPLGEAPGMSPPMFMPGQRNRSFGDELHEVEL